MKLRNGRVAVRRSFGALALLVTFAALTGGCGGSNEPTTTLTPTGQAGREVARAAGCAACHGSDGEGVEGLGPAFVGLFGSTVELADGSSVVADRDYLGRSIIEPDAQVTAGFSLPMPPYQLSGDDLSAILDYLEEVGG